MVLIRWALLSAILSFCLAPPVWATGHLRHVLMDYANIPGGTLYKGEIAYYPSADGIIARLGSGTTTFSTRPLITSIGRASFLSTSTGIVVKAGSQVNATDGTPLAVASDTTFPLSAIHSATPLQVAPSFGGSGGGWNYLWLAKSGSTYSVYASSAAGAPSLPTGVTYDHIGYLGTVQAIAGFLSNPPTFSPIKKIGNLYFPGGGASTQPYLNASDSALNVTLDVPYSASKIRFAMMPTTDQLIAVPTTGIKACFLIGSSDVYQCTFDFGETHSSAIRISHTASTLEVVRLFVVSYEESLDKFR